METLVSAVKGRRAALPKPQIQQMFRRGGSCALDMKEVCLL